MVFYHALQKFIIRKQHKIIEENQQMCLMMLITVGLAYRMLNLSALFSSIEIHWCYHKYKMNDGIPSLELLEK